VSAALSADRVQLQRFIDATFPYADRDSFVSLRCFRDDVDGIALRDEWRCVRVTGNADDLVDAAEDLATLAALDDAPIVFAPPVCSFKTADKADAANLANGLVITAELDSNPGAGRARLEAVLGPATVVVESGGLWIDPETGELLPKLHLHWRLEKPTRAPIEHDFLKEANQLATTLAGGDPTAVPLVHPLRWAGSWHRKATPRMARIVDGDIAREIGLADALNKLREAAKALKSANGHDLAPPKDFAAFAPAELLDITAALACIPNNDNDTPHGASWKQWSDMGLRLYAATGGSDVGLALWLDWSKRSKAFNEAETRARWRHYETNPPTKTNPGALFNLARKCWPDFVRPSELRRQVERDASEPDDWPPPVPFDGELPAPSTSPAGGSTEPDDDVVGPLPDAFSEDRLALNFTAQHHADWRYVALWGAWLQWIQTHWRRENTLRVFELTRRVCREASAFVEKATLARAIASSKTVSGVERLARSDRNHAAIPGQYDASTWDFNQPPRREP